MGVHPVTQAEYEAVIGSNPSFNKGGNNPVEEVSWTDAVAYCAKLTGNERKAGHIPANWSYRLPTEAEREYCARAGARSTRFSYGDDLSYAALGNYAWYFINSGGKTHPVEQKLVNSWGLADMLGNVDEWCQDWFGAYPGGSVTDPQGPPSGTFRVGRGGNAQGPVSACRSAFRSNGLRPDTNRSPGLGFRVVLAPGDSSSAKK
jgi:formylglycine-generating enzyme required for sulfatase activity